MSYGHLHFFCESHYIFLILKKKTNYVQNNIKNIFVYENCNQLDVLCNKHHVSIYLFIYEILAFCINSNLKSVMNHFQQTIVHCTGVLVLMSVAGLYHYHYTLVRRDGTIVKYISLKEEIRQRQIMRMLIFSHSS